MTLERRLTPQSVEGQIQLCGQVRQASHERMEDRLLLSQGIAAAVQIALGGGVGTSSGKPFSSQPWRKIGWQPRFGQRPSPDLARDAVARFSLFATRFGRGQFLRRAFMPRVERPCGAA